MDPTVRAAANGVPCHVHSKNFQDCLNSHEIRLGKCSDHLRLLYQCRGKVLAAKEPSNVQAAPMGNTDACRIAYQKLKHCLKDDEGRLGKCQLHLHALFECHMKDRELWS